MRILAIDYGSQKIGYALSDESGRVAFPGGVLKNDEKTLENFLNLIKEKAAGVIVLGKSLDSSGKPNPMMEEVEAFAINLAKLSGLKIDWCDERFTTNEANRHGGRDQSTDAGAATLILTRYLESLHL